MFVHIIIIIDSVIALIILTHCLVPNPTQALRTYKSLLSSQPPTHNVVLIWVNTHKYESWAEKDYILKEMS